MTNFEMPKIFGHSFSDLINECGPNEWVDNLFETEFDPSNTEKLTLQMASIVAAFGSYDQLDPEHQEKLKMIGELGFANGLDSIQIRRDELRQKANEIDSFVDDLLKE